MTIWERDNVYKKIYDVLEDGEVHCLVEIKKVIMSEQNVSASVISGKLRCLVMEGLVDNVARGKYKLLVGKGYSSKGQSLDVQLNSIYRQIVDIIENYKVKNLFEILEITEKEERKIAILRQVKEYIEEQWKLLD